ncbi:hypothetical protein AMTR_s00106p00051260, partial [Amborella trichopoda]
MVLSMARGGLNSGLEPGGVEGYAKSMQPDLPFRYSSQVLGSRSQGKSCTSENEFAPLDSFESARNTREGEKKPITRQRTAHQIATKLVEEDFGMGRLAGSCWRGGGML